MLLIPCPHCGPRDETEFSCWSEAEPRRPADPSALSQAQWTDYVYNHTNAKGVVREKWLHVKGCYRWIVVERDTLTHRIVASHEADG